jgi:integrase
MRPKEYWSGKWRVGPHYVQVDGTKTKASKRKVPRLFTPTLPSTETQNGFAQALRKVRTDVRPYDARKTFAHRMEEAGISRSRRMKYMGHQVGDVTEIYEQVELARFLEEDADRMKAYLGENMKLLKAVES